MYIQSHLIGTAPLSANRSNSAAFPLSSIHDSNNIICMQNVTSGTLTISFQPSLLFPHKQLNMTARLVTPNSRTLIVNWVWNWPWRRQWKWVALDCRLVWTWSWQRQWESLLLSCIMSVFICVISSLNWSTCAVLPWRKIWHVTRDHHSSCS